ncbi:MAG: molybdate ABC transporter substrate-binding protein [Rhodothermales bacterium]|nr:molybdate ABC transporter substrate-binding protein [Rhodothermales bacterium]
MAILLGGGCAGTAQTDAPLRIASAANFYATAVQLAEAFETEQGGEVEVISGSSGKHVAQILAGAPFDVLLSADTLRPHLLVERGVVERGETWVYAVGRLVAWVPRVPVHVLSDASALGPLSAEDVLRGAAGRIAIANPDLAPYGRAATQVLDRLGSGMQRVRGENASQAFQFVSAGSVEAGLVAFSQVRDEARGQVWVIPDSLYDPIVQGGAVLSDHPAAEAFRRFLDAPRQRSVLERAGYQAPHP